MLSFLDLCSGLSRETLLQMMKTHRAGELRPSHDGEQVTLAGWVNRRRDQGGVIFIDLRDRWGVVQVVNFNQEESPDAAPMLSPTIVRREYVLQVQGYVRIRPEDTANPDLATGEIEVRMAQDVTGAKHVQNTTVLHPRRGRKRERVRADALPLFGLAPPVHAKQHDFAPQDH